ncbi:MAG: transcription repressor NadR [Anaerotruncus sp.]|nr:transcription repressor NadR [Anaerotruncus sp.]
MNAADRRACILQTLQKSDQPVSATALAKQCQVSRQIIVGDVALLRAANIDILATPRGYIFQGKPPSDKYYTIACSHSDKRLRDELYIVVDNGGGLIDVIIDHPIYGQLCGPLRIFSRYDADIFLQKLQTHQASPLSMLTAGVHLHTIVCPSQEAYQRILHQLEENGILLPEEIE